MTDTGAKPRILVVDKKFYKYEFLEGIAELDCDQNRTDLVGIDMVIFHNPCNDRILDVLSTSPQVPIVAYLVELLGSELEKRLPNSRILYTDDNRAVLRQVYQLTEQ
ncbi:MAG: hypothetical protein ABIG95_05505 [Candidatus Woesearchaeota archaeon]